MSRRPEDPLEAILRRWEREARVLARREAHGPLAPLLKMCIQEVRDAARRRPEDWISTEEAMRWSGYTRDYLQVLAREGKVRAERRQGEWWFLRSSLPRKARPESEAQSENLRPSERAARKALGRS